MKEHIIKNFKLITSDTHYFSSSINDSIANNFVILAELRRAKRANGAPWVRLFGKSIHVKKFGYDVNVRPSVRPYRMSGWRWGRCFIETRQLGLEPESARKDKIQTRSPTNYLYVL